MDEATGEPASETAFEAGRLGRVAVIRLRPNQDMVEALEAACAEHGLVHAVVRSAVGSLNEAALGHGHGAAAGLVTVEGPGVEILTMAGEVRPGPDGRPRADLAGTVGDPDARVYGGRFVRGGNPICITLELVLQEWLPDEAAAAPEAPARGKEA